jgi:hypothetical protein
MLQHDRDSIHSVCVAPVQGMEEDIDDGVNQRGSDDKRKAGAE